MIGAIGFAVAAGVVACGVGRVIFQRALPGLSEVSLLAVRAIFGFGVIGAVTMLVGWAGYFDRLPLLAFLFIVLGVIGWLRIGVPKAQSTLPLAAVVCAALLLLRVPAALAPSDSNDWDTLSHQLAMARIWLQSGGLNYIQFMPHSNVPGLVNMLYLWGLWAGDQYAAKILTVLFLALAALAIAGVAGARYGRAAANWAGVATLASPVLLWEAGTAYVDIAHGLWTSLAVLAFASAHAAEEPQDAEPWLLFGGWAMGFALASKYTALPVAGILLFGTLWFAVRRKALRKQVVFAVVLATLVALPWYARNLVNTGNPFYPFLYSVFDGRNWSDENAAAFRAEQSQFGIGVRPGGEVSPAAFGGAITGLALQPDRQVNRASPFGATGPVFLLAPLLWALSGRARRFERALLVVLLLSLVAWFYMTQQSRYITGLVLISSVLAGGLVTLRYRPLAIAAIALQVMWCFALFGYLNREELRAQIAVSTGEITRDEYLNARFDFWQGVQAINSLEEGAKVALYDEVRGFYLTRDYFWANPQHSTMIAYDSLSSGAGLVERLRSLGSTHVYVHLSPVILGPERAARLSWAFTDSTAPIEDEERFRRLLIEAVRQGELTLLSTQSTGTGRVAGLLYAIPNQ
ncbi:MAG: hypothetical protein C4341_07540 [Armatimonadota bacterium]